MTQPARPRLRALRLVALAIVLPVWLALSPFILIAGSEGWPWPDPTMPLATQLFAVAAIYGAPLLVLSAVLSFALPAPRAESVR